MTGLHVQQSSGSGWCMARRRGADRYRPFVVAGAAILATFLLAGAIQLGNSITAMRRDIQDLESDRDNLDAHHAQLAVRWTTQSSRQVIMRRAESELQLICPDAPGTIVVAAAERDQRGPVWKRLWPRGSFENPMPTAIAAETAP